MKRMILVGGFGGIIMLLGIGVSSAGNLDSPGDPSGGSGMVTTTDICNQLDTGVNASPAGTFKEPVAGPGPTGRSLNEIQGKLPATDNVNGAVPSEVVTGKTFWGLQEGEWGNRTGTLEGRSLDPESTAVPAGVYEATTLDAVDPDLISTNIKAGSRIFGIAGDANVVDTASGDATAADLAYGARAFVDGVEITGSAAFMQPPAPVLVTGQTNSIGAGDDGDLILGTSFSPRFKDNTDGTVSDLLTGLVWTKDLLCLTSGTTVAWSTAITLTAALADGNVPCNLSDGSVAGDWRLPNILELESLHYYAENLDMTYLPNGHLFTSDDCTYLPLEPPDSRPQILCQGLWSSTTNSADSAKAWALSGLVYYPVSKDLLVGEAVAVRDSSRAGRLDLRRTGARVSFQTGDDGDLQKGLAWPNPRFVDNGNGTLTDRLTSLIWLKDANCLGEQLWDDARSFAAGLFDGWTGGPHTKPDCGLSDGSAPGDWRLPNMRELLSLVDFAYTNPALSNLAGTGQWQAGDGFTTVGTLGQGAGVRYWTSTKGPIDWEDQQTTNILMLDLYDGSMTAQTIVSQMGYVMLVRGGR